MPVSGNFIFQSTIEILFYSFHLSVLIPLIVKRKEGFGGSFFNIFRIVIIADLLNFVLLVITRKFPELNLFVDFYLSSDTFAGLVFNGLTFVTPIQFLGHTLMAMNRLTVVWFPLKQKSIWHYHWYTILMIVVSVIPWLTRLQIPGVFIISPNLVAVSLKSSEANYFHYVYTSVLYIGTTCVTAMFNLLSFIKFCSAKKLVSSSINVNEKSLLLVSFVSFIAQLIRTSFNLNKVLFPTNQDTASFFNAALPYFNPIFALSGSISLVNLSKTIRKAYLSFYFCKPYHSTHFIMPSSTKFVTTVTHFP